MSNYGKRLKLAMDEVTPKCDRATLARVLGVTVQSIGQVIRGETHRLDMLNHGKAYRFLRVNDIWLATGDGEMRPPKGTAAVAAHQTHSTYAGLLADYFDEMVKQEKRVQVLAFTAACEAIASQVRQAEPQTPTPHSVRTAKKPI
jgi:predicted transcriptional regulator